MELIFKTPYIVRVLASLLIILIINRISKRLSLSVFFGAMILALWTGRSLHTIFIISWERLSSANNIFLMIVIFQVIWLSSQMSLSGVMKELVDRVKGMVSQRTSMALLPAVIGLLPMPGGAIFSAPLVDDCDHDKSIAPIVKTKINYWFRHIWEYWWPMYPGVLLAIDITGLTILQIMALHLPLSILSVTAGYIFLLRKVNASEKLSKNKKSSVKEFISLLFPIIFIIIIYALLRIFLPEIALFNKYLPMIIGIFSAQVFLQIKRKLGISIWMNIVFSRKTINLVLLVALIRIFGAFIEAGLDDGSFIMSHMKTEMSSMGIPFIMIIILIPFISGITTGLAIGFVGASFPIVMSLLGANPGMNELLSAVVLAYASGYMGMILSPVHVCLIVSNEHFNTGIAESIVRLLKPALFLLTGAVLLYLFVRGFLF